MSKCMKGCIAVPALVTVLLSACTSSQQAPDNKQKLERYIRPSVVTILDGCQGNYFYPSGSGFIPSGKLSFGSVGSGYFVSSNGYIVTNAHVTRYANLKDSGVGKCKEALLEQFAKKLVPIVNKKQKDIENVLRKNPETYEADFETVRWVILPNQSKQDPLKFQVTKAGDPQDRDVSILKVEGIDNAPVLLLGDSDKVENTDSILVFGYPNDSNIPGVMSSDSAFKPSVTPGNVSNKQALDSGAPVLQITASVSRGNSGGPVINSSGEVIGMVTFRKAGSEGSGISYAIPAKTVKEMLGEAGAKNEQGRADDLYRKGLDYYWQGNYTDATSQFRQVQGLFRRHSEVEELVLASEAKRAKQGSNLWLWAAIAGIVAAIPALGFILYRRGLVPAGDGIVGSMLERVTGIWQPMPETQPKGQTVLDKPSYGRSTVGQSFLELETRSSAIPLQLYLNQDVHQIGRESEWSDLEIPEHGWEVISRRHAVLRREGANYRIFDGDGNGQLSANGVWIDGKLIDPVKGFLLTNGVQLQFGQKAQTQVTLTYVNPTGKAAPKATYVE